MVQLRSIAQNITFLAVQRAILTMDPSGTSAKIHRVCANVSSGVIAILALSTLAAILILQRITPLLRRERGKLEAKKVADRLLMWGLCWGYLWRASGVCACR